MGEVHCSSVGAARGAARVRHLHPAFHPARIQDMARQISVV